MNARKKTKKKTKDCKTKNESIRLHVEKNSLSIQKRTCEEIIRKIPNHPNE